MATKTNIDNSSLYQDATRYSRLIQREMQRHSTWVEKQCGLSSAHLWFLQELHDAPGSYLGDIMEKMAVQQGTVSNILDPLVKNGYVTKERERGGRVRRVKLAITEEGIVFLGRAPWPTKSIYRTALERMDQDLLTQLVAGYRGLLKAIEELDRGYGLAPLRNVEDTWY